jgi:predicted regulator of amino acid metabolism with ACT domain
MEAQIAWDHFMAVSPRSCILQVGAAAYGWLVIACPVATTLAQTIIYRVVNALAKAGIELGENGDHPQAKGKAPARLPDTL